MIQRVSATILAILILGGLTACGGGGSGGGPTSAPGPIDEPRPGDPIPPPASAAGRFAISGIEKIPQSMLELSNAQMQSRWALVETNPVHGDYVAEVACQSYVTDTSPCEPGDRTRRTRNPDGTVTFQAGATPFMELYDLKWAQGYRPSDSTWFRPTLAGMGASIVTSTDGSGNAILALLNDGNPPYLVVQSAGNNSSNYSFLRIANKVTPEQRSAAANAVRAHKMLFIAGYSRTASGEYIRHWESSGCKDSELEGGCLWTRYEFPGVTRGTSLSSPNVSAALASVLAVFPDTTPQNLARFGKACVKKTGQGIEALLAQSGGLGVADFNCMGDTIAALRSLPTGGTTNISINGNAVSLSNKALIPSFAQSQSARYLASQGEEEQKRLSFRVVPNGEREVMALGVLREGGFFASFGAGQYDSFFGYSRGHGTVSGFEYAFGHENVFLHLSDVTSRGGDLVSWARAKSVGLSAEKDFHPATDVTLRFSAEFDRFLGGEAKIPFGRVKMDEGEWNRRFGVSAEYAADERTTLGLETRLFIPGNGGNRRTDGLPVQPPFLRSGRASTAPCRASRSCEGAIPGPDDDMVC